LVALVFKATGSTWPGWGAPVSLLVFALDLPHIFSLDPRTDLPTVKGLHELLETDADLRRLKELGFNKLVLLSESPVRFAITAVNPGSKRTRVYYPASVSPKVDAWPVVYRSADVLIREIP
jgi:hypothetical protein